MKHNRECCMCPFEKISCYKCKQFTTLINKNDPFANMKFYSENHLNFEEEVIKYLKKNLKKESNMAKKFQIFENNKASKSRLDAQAKQIVRNSVSNSESWLSVINNLEDIKRSFDNEIKDVNTNNDIMPQLSFKSELKDNTLQIWKVNAYNENKYLLLSVGYKNEEE